MNRTCAPSNQEAADTRLRLQGDGENIHNRPTEQRTVLSRSQLQQLRWQQPYNWTYVRTLCSALRSKSPTTYSCAPSFNLAPSLIQTYSPEIHLNVTISSLTVFSKRLLPNSGCNTSLYTTSCLLTGLHMQPISICLWTLKIPVFVLKRYSQVFTAYKL